MARHGDSTSDPRMGHGVEEHVAPIPIEILEDPWTPAAEIERIVAALARGGAGSWRPAAGPPGPGRQPGGG